MNAAPDTIAYAREMRALYRAAEQRAVRFRLLVEMSRDLVTIRDTAELLRVALVRVITFSGYDTGAMLFTDAHGEIRVRAALQIHAPQQPVRLHPTLLQEARRALTDGTMLLTFHPSPSASLAAPAQIYLPLLASDGTPLGVLLLTDAISAKPPDSDDLDALQMLAAQLAATLQNTQLYEARNDLVRQLTERELRLAELVEQLMHTQEEERRRVAYEIHDGLAQMTLGVLHQVQTLHDRFRPRTPAARQALDRALSMARATVDEARRLIAGLRPTVLDDMGLVQAVQLLIRTLQVDGWQVTLNENLSGERLPAVIETALYRIAQEMLNNVRKHTTPCVVGVTLQRDDQIVLLRVHDAGCGFTPTAQPVNCEPGTHIGLTSMQERVGLLRGTWYLESAPNQGTLVEVRIPLAAPEPPKGVADHA